MISLSKFAVSCRRDQWRRGLSYLLLFLIAYGATAAAVHSHGSVSANRFGVTAVSDPGGSSSSKTEHSRDRECSTCQFQQQLFGGLVHAPLFARTPLAEITFVCTLTVFYPSTTTTPSSGRGPPLAQA